MPKDAASLILFMLDAHPAASAGVLLGVFGVLWLVLRLTYRLVNRCVPTLFTAALIATLLAGGILLPQVALPWAENAETPMRTLTERNIRNAYEESGADKGQEAAVLVALADRCCLPTPLSWDPGAPATRAAAEQLLRRRPAARDALADIHADPRATLQPADELVLRQACEQLRRDATRLHYRETPLRPWMERKAPLALLGLVLAAMALTVWAACADIRVVPASVEPRSATARSLTHPRR